MTVGTRGDLVSVQRRANGTQHRRSEVTDNEVIDYTARGLSQLVRLNDNLTLAQAVAAHAAEVVATPAVPAPTTPAVDVEQLQQRLAAADKKLDTADQEITALEQRVETLEAGMKLVLRRLTPHGVRPEDIR